MRKSNNRNRLSSKKSISNTRYLLLLSVFVIVVWCIISPMFLLNQINVLDENKIFSSSSGISMFDKNIDGSTIPSIIHNTNNNKLWTLDNLSKDELLNKDWYEKGKMILDNNFIYLSEAKGKASKQSSNITLISGMFDLGRGDLPDSFKRTFDQYVERFSRFLAYKFPKILFIQPEHYHYYIPYLEKNSEYPVYIINTTIDDIRNFKYFNEIQEMRKKPGWYQRAGWLAESPQASMELYNPMVMSKLLWTRDAAKINPFNTDGFLWIDGGHQCNNPESITTDNDYTFKKYFDKLLITFFDYEPYNEVHGFESNAFKRYINTNDKIVRVGRGGIFGGTKEYLEVAAEIYMLAIGETLNAGYMGTEENIFSILYYRFPELVSYYANGDGGNCAIFTEAIYGPPPPPIEEIIQTDGFDLRGLDCVGSFDNIVCYDKNIKCPDIVNPFMLTEAKDQYSCNLRGYYCTVSCIDDKVYWFSHSCPEIGECPPHGRVEYSIFYKEESNHNNHIHAITPPLQIDNNISNKQLASKSEIEFTKKIQSKYSSSTKSYIQENGYDLRGLECENKNGNEVCFLNHKLGRDICPPEVTSSLLTLADGQWNCQNEPNTYCVVTCQDGTDRYNWIAYNIEWCKENPESCAPRPSKISYNDFIIHDWSEEEKIPKKCENIPISEFNNLPPFTVGVLARGTEIESLTYALETWSNGFMQYVDEYLFFINDYSDLIADLLEPYTKPPFNIKIRYSNKNEGILKGINWLIGNSTNEHILFLEKDFRLVESLPCTLDQMRIGFELLDNNKADVIKYRSRYNGGKPNWADILYREKESTVFDNQPNLLCNFYHWIDHPEIIWPQYFKICSEDPIMYCVDAEFCNWTNNPFFITKSWWIDNYLNKHWEIQSPPDGFDLETWMNWNIDAWNHRGWTIAEGDGMFKHADVFKFGV